MSTSSYNCVGSTPKRFLHTSTSQYITWIMSLGEVIYIMLSLCAHISMCPFKCSNKPMKETMAGDVTYSGAPKPCIKKVFYTQAINLRYTNDRGLRNMWACKFSTSTIGTWSKNQNSRRETHLLHF